MAGATKISIIELTSNNSPGRTSIGASSAIGAGITDVVFVFPSFNGTGGAGVGANAASNTLVSDLMQFFHLLSQNLKAGLRIIAFSNFSEKRSKKASLRNPSGEAPKSAIIIIIL